LIFKWFSLSASEAILPIIVTKGACQCKDSHTLCFFYSLYSQYCCSQSTNLS
jgi:hypothetical protein